MPATWSVNNTQPRASAAVDTNSPASSTDGEQFSTVYEVPRRDRSKESQGYETSSITGLPLNQPRSGHSRDASPGSTIGQSYTEKLAEPGPRRLKHKPPTINLQDRDTWSKDLTPLRNGDYRDSMAAQPFMLASPKKRKNRSFGTIIRRMFGKRSVKNRISMPTPSAYHNVRLAAAPPFARANTCLGSKHFHYFCHRPQSSALRLRLRPNAKSLPLQCFGLPCTV